MKYIYLFLLSIFVCTPLAFAAQGDSDGDGFQDTIDKCPEKPENINGYQDKDGCPDSPLANTIAPEEIKMIENDSEFGNSSLDEILYSLTHIENIVTPLGIDVSFTDLIAYSIGMVVYGIFIWNFYRYIARREMIPLGLKKYQTGGRKVASVIVYLFKYVIVFPLVVLVWFVVYSTFLFFMAPDLSIEHVFLIVISLVVTVRISAYYKEDLAKDFAKLIPFALLGIFLTSNIFFTIEQVADRLGDFIPFLGKIIGFVIYAIMVEAILRILFLVKRKILPVADEKLEEKIEEQIDEKIKVHVEKIEENHKKNEKKIENETEKIKETVEKNADDLKKNK